MQPGTTTLRLNRNVGAHCCRRTSRLPEVGRFFCEFLFSHRYLRNQVGPQIQVSSVFFRHGRSRQSLQPVRPGGECEFRLPRRGTTGSPVHVMIRPMIGVPGRRVLGLGITKRPPICPGMRRCMTWMCHGHLEVIQRASFLVRTRPR